MSTVLTPRANGATRGPALDPDPTSLARAQRLRRPGGVWFRCAFDNTSAAKFLITVPEIIWELSLGIYLTVKGFRASSPLLQRMQQRSGEETVPASGVAS